MRRAGRPHLLVLAKAPVPGRVKTRLCPPCSPAEAAAVAAAALADTLAAVAACAAPRKVLALDGDPGDWLPPGFVVVPQAGNGLDERLAHAWAAAGGPGVQVGMDTPQVTPADLDALLASCEGWSRRRALLGPAEDGGWWAIGLPECDPWAVFRGVPASTSWTAALQAHRLRRLGFEIVAAERRRDVDTFEDLLAVAQAAPWTRTAAVARTLGPAAQSAAPVEP